MDAHPQDPLQGAIFMRRLFSMLVIAVALSSAHLAGAPAFAADDYTVDPVHSSVSFKIQHLGISWVHGRFNTFKGSFAIDKADPAKSSFELTINADSVDTANKQRDTHLNSPDFFDANQFPTITFKSTRVKPTKEGYEVTGEMTMHGKTKPISLKLEGGKEAEFPKGMKRTGFSTDFTLKRSDFGMVDKQPGALGDEVHVSIGIEGTRK
jgi:polyisoprenoid-binding protein YceI